ncbi:hypothetical protein POTOM_053886 [Populus tomentosa]|uniref:DUF7795 domain-containing protein n=1 Tax=Populus tomentosa TaxID=118781 RepID=A0A8X8C6I2_POPTO|nr:hypothetical protein POTOM_053886 [Populus tomentosa]
MEGELKPELKEKVSNIFQDFLTRITKLEELAGIGSRLLNGYQQALEFLRRPPIDETSQLIKNIIKANETKRVKSYIEAGCINVHDSIQNTNKLHTCLLGLHNHLSKVISFGRVDCYAITCLACYLHLYAKSLLNELEHLLEDLSGEIKTANLCLPPLKNEDCGDQLYQQITTDQNTWITKLLSRLVPNCLTCFYLVEKSSFELGELEMTNYAVLMGIIYSMVKQDYVMQERIVNSLNLKSLSGELESYCVMWSLRPFIMDEVMHHAWRLIP